MSFQNIIDNAAEIIVNSQPLVASTTTRDGTVRSVSRGGQPWVFTVTLPDGPRWTDYREIIATAEGSDRHTSETIQFNNSGYDWLFPYQGNYTPPNVNGSFFGNWTKGNDTALVYGGTGSGNRFVAGDLLQLRTGGHVYKVIETTIGSTIKLHRPILDENGPDDVFVGTDCTFTVRATQFPQPRIFARNQVGFTGSFVFVEVID